MEPTYFAQYRGFEFQCSPYRIGNQAFAPRLVVSDSNHLHTLEIPLGDSTAPFESPTAAARHAFAQGRQWVDDGFSAAERQQHADAELVVEAPLLQG